MKKLLIIGLSGIITMSFLFTSCGKRIPPSGSVDTSTPQRDENSVAVWWDTDGADYNILTDYQSSAQLQMHSSHTILQCTLQQRRVQ